MFGTTQLYVFIDHTKYQAGELPDYEDAMEEVAASAGFDTSTEDKSPGMLTSDNSTISAATKYYVPSLAIL